MLQKDMVLGFDLLFRHLDNLKEKTISQILPTVTVCIDDALYEKPQRFKPKSVGLRLAGRDFRSAGPG